MGRKTVEELREDVVALLKEFNAELKVLNMDRQSRLLEEKMEEIRKGVFQVLFTGTFDSGKSTTLNALIRNNLLSTSINPETPVIIRVVNGENREQVTVTYRGGNRPDEVMGLGRFQKEFRLDDKDKAKFQDILYVTVEWKLPIDTVVLVDSPGLENSDIDDFIAKEYAAKADAVVFMMQATRPLARSDKEYIQKHYEHRNLTNVFIVVNWWNQVNIGEEEEVKERVQNELHLMFEDENGVFNQELYDKRVFFVDSLTSFCYRTNTTKKVLVGRREVPIQITAEDDETSGIPEFERALLDFLSSGDKDRAGYIGYMRNLAGMYKESCESIRLKNKAAKVDLDKLRGITQSHEDSIKKLNETLDGIQGTFDNTIDAIMLNAGSCYDDFVRSVENNWNEYFSQIEIDFGIKQGAQIIGKKIKGAFQRLGRKFTGEEMDEVAEKLARDIEFQRIMEPIVDKIKDYIREESEKMCTNIMAKSDTSLKRMNQSLEAYGEDLEEIQGEGINLKGMVGKLMKECKVNVDAISGEANLAQVLISIVLFNNFDDAAGNLLTGDQGWGAFFKEVILTELTEIIVGMVVGILTGTVVFYIIGRVIYGLFKFRKRVQSLGNAILLDSDHKTRNEVVNGLRNQRASVLTEVEVKFDDKFKGACHKLTAGLKDDINQQQRGLEELVKKRDKAGFDAKKEAQMMNSSRKRLLAAYNELESVLGMINSSEDDVLKRAVSTVAK